MAGSGHPDLPKNLKPHFTHLDLEVILGIYWSLGGLQNRIEFSLFCGRVLWRIFGPFGGPKDPKGAMLEHFGATSGNVKTMLPLVREQHFGGSRGSRATSVASLRALFFSHAFWKTFFAEISRFGPSLGPVWKAFGSLSARFLRCFFRV